MARKKTHEVLEVYLNNLEIGTLSYKSKKELSFAYSQNWLDKKTGFPISRSLPLREDSYEGAEVYAYFDNLLPDGISIRQRVAARMHAKSDQVFDLLAVVGRDCVGALQFIRPGDKKSKSEKPIGTLITNAEIAEKLKNLRTIPLAASDEEDFRLSIAGAQEKTAFLKMNKEWYIPHDTTPTTHIFKPEIGEIRPGLSFADSVENEWLCAEIVRAFGIPMAECEISHFDDVKVLVVERFDRAWLDNRLIRIPQEDMCQALSIPNFEKYESDGGPSIKQIMDLLNESKNRDKDRNNFMKVQIVFLLLAAIDGHAKNFSITWRPNGFEMTPLYDVLSAYPLIKKGAFRYEKLKMAMAYGDSKYYRLKDITRRHLLQTAKICKFETSAMEKIIDETIEQIPDVISTVTKVLPKGFPKEVSESIFNGMKTQSTAFTS